MGGGAAGWCSQQLAIVPTAASFDPERSNDTFEYVFSVSCDSSVTLEWAAEDRLRVSYSLGDAVTVTQKPHTQDSTVTLEYAVLQ
jgi:hypothetical protein